MSAENNNCCYDSQTLRNLRFLYAMAICLWVVILNGCGISRKISTISLSIMFFPIALMILAMANLHKITKTIEEYNSKANYISLGLIVAIPLLSWIKTQKETENRAYEKTSMVLFVMLIMITPMDVWVSEKDQAYVVHIKSICQIFVLAILVSMLLNYFDDRVTIK